MPTAPAFRSRLTAREPLYGAWSVIPSPLSVRLLAAAGLDYVVIDLQHGGATEHDLPAMTDAIRLAGAAPVGRVRHAHPADIGRALDLGCEGIIVPNVDSAAQARDVASAVRYPPAGRRSAGGVLAARDPFCLVMVESAEAVASLDDTLAVDGVDGIYVGPRDLSLALGCELDPDDPVLNPAFKPDLGRLRRRGQARRGARLRRRHRRPVPRGGLYPAHGHRRRLRRRPRHRRPARPRPGLRRGPNEQPGCPRPPSSFRPGPAGVASESGNREVEATAREEAPDARDESAAERADRNLAELLQELRVAGLGVQVLFGFLLSLPFTNRFAELGSGERGLYLATWCWRPSRPRCCWARWPTTGWCSAAARRNSWSGRPA